jgi:hypothetical protein
LKALRLSPIFVAPLIFCSCSSEEQVQDPTYQEATEIALDLRPSVSEEAFAEARAVEENAVAKCMKTEGFKYTPQLENIQIVGDPSDRKYREQYGYLMSIPSPPRPARKVSLQKTLEKLSKEEQTAFLKSLKPCQENASTLFEAGFQKMLTAEQKANAIVDRARADPEWQKLDTEWSQCVRNATGISVKNSSVAEDYIRARIKQSGIQEIERKLAVADLDCALPQRPERTAILEQSK